MEINDILQILNRDDLNVRLYFTQKLGRDNYVSYSPTMAEPLQQSLKDIICENLCRYVDFDQVEFNPIGSADSVIEYTTIDYIQTFTNVIESFEEERVIRENLIDEMTIQRLNFYCLKVEYTDDHGELSEIILLRRITKFKKLATKGFFGRIQNNQFVKLESDLLGIDGDIDIVIKDGVVLILNHIAMERIFSLIDQYGENAIQTLGYIQSANRISNFQQFYDDCLSDQRVKRILTKLLAEPEILENCFVNFENVLEVIEIFELEIEVVNEEGNNVLVYEGKSQLMDIVRLARDSYYRSLINRREVVNEGI